MRSGFRQCLYLNAKPNKEEGIVKIQTHKKKDIFIVNPVISILFTDYSMGELFYFIYGHSRHTVSYTHLDVYKRQTHMCLCMYILFCKLHMF